MTIINDGTGKQGLSAKVDSSFRLLTTTIARSLQNAISLDAQRAYQVIGTVSLASGTVIPMHIKRCWKAYCKGSDGMLELWRNKNGT